MPSRIASIAIHAVQPKLVADFWCAVLDWHVLEQDDEVISIGPTNGTWPGIDVLRVSHPKTGHNRIHLDLRADGISTERELQRLLGLGARPTDVGQDPDVSWVVLADPEGNEFCLLSRTAQELSDQQ